MKFFRLKDPGYASDTALARANPVVLEPQALLPSIDCDCCDLWSTIESIRLSFDALTLDRFRDIRILERDRWMEERPGWARSLGVAEEQLRPGIKLGLPRGRLTGPLMEEVVHPFPGYIWVGERAHELLMKSGLTGMELLPAELVSPSEYGAPLLWEIGVRGVGWRVGTSEEDLVECNACGKRQFPNPKTLTVDAERWDGSDFFRLDRNHGMTFVTERVRDFFQTHHLGNVLFQPVGCGESGTPSSH
jgi:uncharacterized protein CXXCG